jgi:diguanylate cyclase (GGDEF)-like protein/PAS domain S-box-containing protein
MGPAALVLLLVLRHFGLIAREPLPAYLAVFLAIPAASVVVELLHRRRPSRATLHLRVAVHAAAVCTVIYLTGWGPVLAGCFVFIALENISRSGARVWRVTMAWSLAGIALGQLALWQGWVPSFLPVGEAEALGVMGAFVLVFVIRMAGLASEEKEEAEAQVRTSEDRFRSLVQNSSDTTFVMGSLGVITYSSPALANLLGIDPEDVIGMAATDLVHADDRDGVAQELTERINSGAAAEPTQFRMNCADGTWRFVEAIVSDLRDRPSVGGYVANIRDITERKQFEAQLAHEALHDPLTGLPNRALLVDRLRHAIALGARRDGPPPVVMFLDLDRFKLVNDSLGHGAGDLLLMEVADRLRSFTRASDTVSRFGGDEFVILCEEMTSRQEVTSLAQRIMASFEEPFTIDGEMFHVGVSIGVALVDEDFPSAEELLSDADCAMYLAKARSGQGRVQLFDQAARALARQRIHTETALARALHRGELEVYFQPIVELETARRCGAEALVRWNHPTRGLLPPAEFLDVAEQTGIIVPIGEWVMAEACRQVRDWNLELAPDEQLSLSVNLSGRQLAEPDLAMRVADLFVELGIGTEDLSLYLEITEGLLPSNEEEALRQLDALHRLGVRLSIDDFGTGYSSLRYVREVAVDVVKIDQSFISGVGSSRRDETIVKSVIQLAKTLGLKVVAEGVTSAVHADRLTLLGCDFAQGYFFGRPVAASEFWRDARAAAS